MCEVDGTQLHTHQPPFTHTRRVDDDDQVRLYVNKLTSTKTQIPFDYYSLPFCHPKKITEESENLGEVLSGDRIEKNTLYEVRPRVGTNIESMVRLIDPHTTIYHPPAELQGAGAVPDGVPRGAGGEGEEAVHQGHRPGLSRALVRTDLARARVVDLINL